MSSMIKRERNDAKHTRTAYSRQSPEPAVGLLFSLEEIPGPKPEKAANVSIVVSVQALAKLDVEIVHAVTTAVSSTTSPLNLSSARISSDCCVPDASCPRISSSMI